mmetsp:Transcript_35897/g.80806  ORF Transcript_35897/g.80806 Transcript_35897/m.80806 type:complete len:214 (-) Transcript_35897:228-869(-)
MVSAGTPPCADSAGASRTEPPALSWSPPTATRSSSRWTRRAYSGFISTWSHLALHRLQHPRWWPDSSTLRWPVSLPLGRPYVWVELGLLCTGRLAYLARTPRTRPSRRGGTHSSRSSPPPTSRTRTRPSRRDGTRSPRSRTRRDVAAGCATQAQGATRQTGCGEPRARGSQGGRAPSHGRRPTPVAPQQLQDRPRNLQPPIERGGCCHRGGGP